MELMGRVQKWAMGNRHSAWEYSLGKKVTCQIMNAPGIQSMQTRLF
jgi:hypothetical protein